MQIDRKKEQPRLFGGDSRPTTLKFKQDRSLSGADTNIGERRPVRIKKRKNVRVTIKNPRDKERELD